MALLAGNMDAAFQLFAGPSTRTHVLGIGGKRSARSATDAGVALMVKRKEPECRAALNRPRRPRLSSRQAGSLSTIAFRWAAETDRPAADSRELAIVRDAAL